MTRRRSPNSLQLAGTWPEPQLPNDDSADSFSSAYARWQKDWSTGDRIVRGLDLFEAGALDVTVCFDGSHQPLESQVVAERLPLQGTALNALPTFAVPGIAHPEENQITVL